MKVFFATPTFDARPNAEYLHSMIDTLRVLQQIGVEANVYFQLKDSYIHRARNSLCRKFLETDATDFFFIDADMGWDPTAPAKLLALPYDFVGGAYPVKEEEERYPVNILTDNLGRPLVDQKTGCIEAGMLPTGFWRLRRSVIEFMRDLSDWYWDDEGKKTYALFETPIIDHQWFGEDPYFCRRWKEYGGEIWLYPNIDFKHIGLKTFRGNYHEYMMRQPGGSKAQAEPDMKFLTDAAQTAESLKAMLAA